MGGIKNPGQSASLKPTQLAERLVQPRSCVLVVISIERINITGLWPFPFLSGTNKLFPGFVYVEVAFPREKRLQASLPIQNLLLRKKNKNSKIHKEIVTFHCVFEDLLKY